MLHRLVLLALLALSLRALPARAIDSAAQAREQFQKGQHALDAGRSQEAIDAFEAAYAAGGAPSLLFFLGEAYRQAGDRSKAISEYQLYLEKLPDGPKSSVAEARIAELKKAPAAEKSNKRKVALEDLAVGANQEKRKIALDDLEVGANKAPPAAQKKVSIDELELGANKPAPQKKVALDDLELSGKALPPQVELVPLTPATAKLVAPPPAARVEPAKSARSLAAERAEKERREAQSAPLPPASLALVVPAAAPPAAAPAPAPAAHAPPAVVATAPAPAAAPVAVAQSAAPAAPIAAAQPAPAEVSAPAAAMPLPPAPAAHEKERAPLAATEAPADVPLELRSPPATPQTGHSQRVAGVVVGSVGAAAMVAGGLFGAGAMKAASDVNADGAAGRTYDPAVQSRGQRDQLLEAVFLASGGAALATGGLLYLLAPKSSGAHADGDESRSSSRGYAAAIAPVPGGGVAATAAMKF